MEETLPVRFTYTGNTFTNTSSLQGKLKEVTQTGVEYIGDDSVEADAELITLAVQTLLAAGLKEFQISIGEIEYFKGLCEEAGLDKETELEVREQISMKNYFGVEELLLDRKIPKEKIEAFLKITDLFGSFDSLGEAEKSVTNDRSKRACTRLKELYQLLKISGVAEYVSFDMGMVSKYNYYTGIIFRAYTYGVGDAVLTGGRYDDLLSYFGKNAAAIGFMIVVDDLMSAMASQKIRPQMERDRIMLLYDKAQYKEAFNLAVKHRAEGKKVALYAKDEAKSKEDYLGFAKANFTDEVWYLQGEHVEKIQIAIS